MEEIGVKEVREDIGGTQVSIDNDFGIRGGDLVSYVEWGKCGAVFWSYLLLVLHGSHPREVSTYAEELKF